MTISKLIITAILMASISTPLNAAELAGKNLKAVCEPDASNYGQGLCTGYSMGAWTALTLNEKLTMDICLKENLSGEMVTDAVKKYLNMIPSEELSMPAYETVFIAVTTTYRCGDI